MQIENVAIDKLIQYEFNNKIHDDTQIDRIANSIKEFWFLQPLVIEKDNTIIVWHWRYLWAKKLWLKELPCVRVENLTDEQIKKYRILDNRLNESAYNMENLKVELDELDNFNIGDLEISIDELFPDLQELDEEEQKVEEDEAPKVSAEAKIVGGGDLFQLWNHRLMCGDATKIENIHDLIDWNQIQMVYTDPPYWMNLDADFSKMKSKIVNKKWWNYDQVIWDCDDFKDELINTIFDNFADVDEIFVWGWDYYPELLKDYKKWNYIVWDKRIEESTDKWRWSCFELCRSKQKHKKDIVRIKRFWMFGMENEDTSKRVHPTQKPTKLAWRFLERYSKKNDNVCDLYWWSWSTLIACEQLNRKCFMLELDPKYCEVIIKRFHKINPDAEIKCLNRNIDLTVLFDEE